MKQIYLTGITLVFLYLTIYPTYGQDVPLVFDREQATPECADPTLPDYDDLLVVRPLPDPFMWSDGSGRSTRYQDWACRRAEIKAEIQHYEIGEKPDRPADIVASYKGDTLHIKVTVNDETLHMTAAVTLPDGAGPFPAVIGIGRGSGSLPPEIFSNRNVAQIAFNFSQVMSHTQTRGEEPINKLYPDLTYMGAYSAWSWGVSRLIDGLELVADDLPVDLSHLAITGCSFAGKMALFAGAFDERIALTIAQESGGGGAAAWRVSETLGNVEVLGSTSNAWFIEDLFMYSNNVSKLPYDHHELMAMVAPRALLLLGNPDYEWLADESGYVSCKAAHEVWKTFGIGDRFGYSIVDQHQHCRLPDSQKPEVEAFVDKFLLGKTDVNTNIKTHPFQSTNDMMWHDGWSRGQSTFPVPDKSNVRSAFYEVECANLGSSWKRVSDEGASHDYYVTVQEGLNSPDSATVSEESIITVPFSIDDKGMYYIYARLNCASASDDSFYIKIDDEEFKVANGLRTNGWEWVEMSKASLETGEHTLTITYREDGARIDKVGFTTYVYGPEGMGGEAMNACR